MSQFWVFSWSNSVLNMSENYAPMSQFSTMTTVCCWTLIITDICGVEAEFRPKPIDERGYSGAFSYLDGRCNDYLNKEICNYDSGACCGLQSANTYCYYCLCHSEWPRLPADVNHVNQKGNPGSKSSGLLSICLSPSKSIWLSQSDSVNLTQSMWFSQSDSVNSFLFAANTHWSVYKAKGIHSITFRVQHSADRYIKWAPSSHKKKLYTETSHFIWWTQYPGCC